MIRYLPATSTCLCVQTVHRTVHTWFLSGLSLDCNYQWHYCCCYFAIARAAAAAAVAVAAFRVFFSVDICIL